MSHNDHVYHRERELHCRGMAERAPDSDVRHWHEELGSLHAAPQSTPTPVVN
jgi:hypothetical protein